MKARLLICMSGMATIFSGVAGAGSFSTEPVIGGLADYSSNPLLRNSHSAAETHGAVLLDVPLRFDTEDSYVELRPRARYGDSRGYASLASNYEYLDATARFNDERGSVQLGAEAARDSSLYYAGELSNGVGVRRDTGYGYVNWDRALTERFDFQSAASWTQVRYGRRVQISNLTDYRYLNFAPSLAFSASERNIVRLVGSAGRYNAIDGFTRSTDESLQLGFDRQLTEIWKVSTTFGYSRSVNRYNFGLGSFQTAQNGGVYSASLLRNGERTSFAATFSRELKPTGFAYSSRQDSADLNGTYDRSERWSFSMRAGWKKFMDPNFGLGTISHRYYEVGFSADWHWTQEWVLTGRVSRISQRNDTGFDGGLPGFNSVSSFNAASNSIDLEFTRHFRRIEL